MKQTSLVLVLLVWQRILTQSLWAEAEPGLGVRGESVNKEKKSWNFK